MVDKTPLEQDGQGELFWHKLFYLSFAVFDHK